MKKLTLLLAIGCVSFAAKSQTIQLINNTGCPLRFEVRSSPNTPCSTPFMPFTCGIAGGGPILMPSSTVTVGQSSFPCFSVNGFTVYPDGVSIFEPSGSSTPTLLGSGVCGYATQTGTVKTTCGLYTATWTDLGGGNAMVDVN